LTAKVPDVACGVGKLIVKSTLLLLVSPVVLVMEFKIVGDGAAPIPSYWLAKPYPTKSKTFAAVGPVTGVALLAKATFHEVSARPTPPPTLGEPSKFKRTVTIKLGFNKLMRPPNPSDAC